jgi:NinB protein
MKYEIYSTVNNGNIKQNRNLFIDAIKSFEGKGIVITIEKRKNKRSNPQNAFFHGIVLPLVYNGLKELGHTMPLADVKDLLKLKFLKVPIFANEETGEITEKIKNTSELTTTEFMEFVSEIQRWSIENLGVNIPDPNENLKLKI